MCADEWDIGKFEARRLAFEQSSTAKHDFFIEDLGRPPGWFKHHRYRYSCLRCGWAFLVESRGHLTALDEFGEQLPQPLQSLRVKTFALGPCTPASTSAAQRRDRANDKPAIASVRAVRRRRAAVAALTVANRR